MKRTWLIATLVFGLLLVALPASAQVTGGTGSTDRCQRVVKGAVIETNAGTLGKPVVDTKYCDNKRRTRITTMRWLACGDNGGFANFDGCTVRHESLPTRELAIYGTWNWSLAEPISGLGAHWTCTLNLLVYPDGSNRSNWWCDNVSIRRHR